VSSQIGNQALLRAIGDALDVESVKQAPSQLNTAEIVAALMLHTGFANYEKWCLPAVSNVSIAGANSVPISLVAQNPVHTSYPDYTHNSQGREVVILGYYVNVIYTAGGAATDANVPLQLNTHWYEPDLGVGSNAGLLETWSIVVATRLTYTFGFPFWGKQHSSYYTAMNHADNRIWVPAGSEYGLTVFHGGAGFPAGTTFGAQAFGISVPKGVCPPLCG